MGMLNDFLKKKQEEEREKVKALGIPVKRMYATERDAFLQLRMVSDMLSHLNADFAARYEMAGITDVMLRVTAEVKDALARVYFSAPEDQRDTLDRNADNVTYAVGVKTPGAVGVRSGDSKWGVYVAYSDMSTICDALHDHCLTCMGSAQEQSACELRKVFDRIGVNAEHKNGECGFRELI